jgi:hypothetical protein
MEGTPEMDPSNGTSWRDNLEGTNYRGSLEVSWKGGPWMGRHGVDTLEETPEAIPLEEKP